MKAIKLQTIHATEFNCQTPLKFYEHCAACPRFGQDCPDMLLGLDIIRGKKSVVYNGTPTSDEAVHVSSFNCLAPLYYFEETRKKCAHRGRCREEGLLLALLSGKKHLGYARKEPIQLQRPGALRREAGVQEVPRSEASR